MKSLSCSQKREGGCTRRHFCRVGAYGILFHVKHFNIHIDHGMEKRAVKVNCSRKTRYPMVYAVCGIVYRILNEEACLERYTRYDGWQIIDAESHH